MSGYFDHQTGNFVYVDEMEPELIVPDLTDFKVCSFPKRFSFWVERTKTIFNFQLKPYVSYDATDIRQGEFSPGDLFNATYAKSIVEQFKSGEIKPIDEDFDQIDSNQEKSANVDSTSSSVK